MTVVLRPLAAVTFPRGGRRTSYGLLVGDVGVSYPGMQWLYLAVQDDPEQQLAAVVQLQKYARARNLYTFGPRDPDGTWGTRTEAAFRGLLPGASGVTTTRMLGSLERLSSAVFGAYATLFGIGISRDKWLRRTRGTVQTDVDLSARNEQSTLTTQPGAWNPTQNRVNEVDAGTSSPTRGEADVPSNDVLAVDDPQGTARPPSTTKKSVLPWAVGGLLLAAALGAVVVATRKPKRRPAKRSPKRKSSRRR